MGLKDKLANNGSPLSQNNGVTPPIPNFKGSKLHDEYSLNGTPHVQKKPSPSELDLDGKTPAKYTDNLPG